MTTTEAPRLPATPSTPQPSSSIRRALLAAAAAGLLGGCLGLVACDDGETAHPAKRATSTAAGPAPSTTTWSGPAAR